MLLEIILYMNELLKVSLSKIVKKRIKYKKININNLIIKSEIFNEKNIPKTEIKIIIDSIVPSYFIKLKLNFILILSSSFINTEYIKLSKYDLFIFWNNLFKKLSLYKSEIVEKILFIKLSL